jgi:Hypervirulence associated proteins TUDOR domain
MEATLVSKVFKRGDRVAWNSEAGRVSGRIVKKITSDARLNDYTHHASKETPQYIIKSEKTDHVAIHKGGALTHLKAATKSRPGTKRKTT